jgi:hypothetical protein
MYRIKSDESEVLDSFFAKAMSDNMLEKTAEKLYPDFDISAPKKNDLQDLVVVASADNRLYGLPGDTGEQMVGKAHPGGGVAIELDNNAPRDKDLAKVETIVERAKVMREVAESKPTGKMVLAKAVAKLISIANLLEDNGESALAAELDLEISKLAEDFNQSPADGNYGTEMSMNKAPVKQKDLGRWVSEGEPGPFAESTPVAKPELTDEVKKAQALKTKNTQLIQLLNELRKAEGLAPLAASPLAGIVTKEVQSELARSVSGGYSNWGELFGHIRGRIADAKSAPAQGAGVDPEALRMQESPSGAPLSGPDLSSLFDHQLPESGGDAAGPTAPTSRF